MAKKIVKLKNDAQYYFEKGVERSDAGEYVLAIDNFYSSLDRDDVTNPVVLSELAYAYLALGLNEKALEFYFYLLCQDPYSEVAYLGLIRCFAERNPSAALYYLNRGIDEGVLSEDFQMNEGIEVEFEERKKPLFSLYDGRDNSELINIAKGMLAGGENELARHVYEEVPEDSKQYVDAKNGLAFIELNNGNYSDASQLCDLSLARDPKNFAALNTKMIAQARGGNEQGALETAKIIDEMNVSDLQYLYSAATSFMESGLYEYSEKYFERAYNRAPYQRDCTLAYALHLYNRGKKADAKAHLLDLRRLYPEDSVVGYYARAVNAGESEWIKPAFTLPTKEKNRRLNNIESVFSELSDINKVNERLAEDEDLYDSVMWLLDSNDNVTAEKVGVFLCQTQEWHPYFEFKFVDYNVSPMLKREWLNTYLCFSESKKFKLVVGFVQMEHDATPPKCNDNHRMREAYWRFYSTAVFVCPSFRKEVRRAYKKAVKLMSAPDFEPFEIDVDTMSAVLAKMTGLKSFNDDALCVNLFNCKKDLYEQYLQRLGIKNSKDDRINAFRDELMSYIEGLVDVDEPSFDQANGEQNPENNDND